METNNSLPDVYRGKAAELETGAMRGRFPGSMGLLRLAGEALPGDMEEGCPVRAGWRLPAAFRECMGECRITPAYAGNTEEKMKKAAIYQDHPRVCGEHARNSVNVWEFGRPPAAEVHCGMYSRSVLGKRKG